MAGQLAGAMPVTSLSPVAMPTAGIPSAGMPPATRPVRSVSALGRSAAAGESDADRAVTAMYGSQYRSLVRLAVLLVGDLRMAEEVVQESFAAMHHTWRRLRNHDAALSFLHRAVVARSRLAGPGLAVAPRYEAPSDEAGGRALRAVPLRAAGPSGAAETARAEGSAGLAGQPETGHPPSTGASAETGESAETGRHGATEGSAQTGPPDGTGTRAGTGAPDGAGTQAGTGAQHRAGTQAGADGQTAAAEPAGVVAALRGLPVMQREALALRLYLDLPDDQIAAAMRVSHATARSHVAGGLAALRGTA